MLVSTLITRLREDYLDDTLGVDTNDSLVSETALIRFADEAQDQACRRMDLIYDDTTTAVIEHTIVEDQRNYTLHDTVTKLERVTINNMDLVHKTESMLTSDNPSFRSADSGTPTSYFMRGRTIYLDPAPDSTAATHTLDLAVYRRPITTLTAIYDSFEVMDESINDLIYWMLYRVYNLRDEDLTNPTQAKFYHSLFTEAYGPVVPIDVRIHQFESPEVQTLRQKTGYSYTGSSSLADEDFDASGWA